jgi:hypothetical protein
MKNKFSITRICSCLDEVLAECIVRTLVPVFAVAFHHRRAGENDS